MLTLRKQIGFSLLELLVTVAVIAVLAGFALPNLGGIIATSQLNNAQENVMQVLKKAHANSVANGTFTTATVTSATNTLQVTYLNGSTPPPNVILNKEIVVDADIVFTFSPNGTVSATPVNANPAIAGVIQLNSATHSDLPVRGINVSMTGQIAITR